MQRLHCATIWAEKSSIVTSTIDDFSTKMVNNIHINSSECWIIATWIRIERNLQNNGQYPVSLYKMSWNTYFDGLVQDCSNSIAHALELLQLCTKPSIWFGMLLWEVPSSASPYFILKQGYTLMVKPRHWNVVILWNLISIFFPKQLIQWAFHNFPDRFPTGTQLKLR